MIRTPHIVAVAGGSGTRFWPLSRRHSPKQLQDLGTGTSLLAATFERVRALAPPSHWWMVVGADHGDACVAAVPEVQAARVLREPVPRNTAPAIGLAALHVQAHDPQAVMVILPADHFVRDVTAFQEAVRLALPIAEAGGIVTLGIRPSYPETGYGYIERGAPYGGAQGAWQVARFREKPSAAAAQALLDAGDCYWNAGIFVFRPATVLAELARQRPKIAAALEDVRRALAVDRRGLARKSDDAYAEALTRAFAGMESVSIDYAVMEGAERVAVVPVDCGWSDVGSWGALRDIVPADNQGNALMGDVVALDSRDCVAFAPAGHAVALLGVSGLTVVHTPDATLVLPTALAQDVRRVVQELEVRAWRRYL